MRKNTLYKVSAPDTTEGTKKRNAEIDARTRRENQPKLERWSPNASPGYQSIPEFLTSKIQDAGTRDSVRMLTHGLARTGNTLLRVLDIPNRVFGNTRSRLQDIYEASERNLARDRYENPSAVTQFGEAAVNIATSAGVLGKAMAPAFGAETAASTYEMGKQLGNDDVSSMSAGLKHGVKDTAIWTIVPELASRMLPKSWQLVGKAIGGALAGAESSNLAFDTYRSLGADLSPEEQRQAAVHAAWMVPLLGMFKMGGKRREEAMALLRRARPDLNGITRTTGGSTRSVEKVIEVLENEFDDPRSQKIALQWVARKGANLPDDIASIKSALEVAAKVKGVDPMQMSPAEFLSNPQYAKFLPKPKPENVKAFSNMRRYPEGVIGFDVKDDAEGRQATREMINAYMSPSANPWCLAKGNGAGKLTEGAEGYWNQYTAVPKQIFFQNIDGHLELLAFRATGRGAEGRREYWDTSDAPHAGIPLKMKIPGDKLGRYKLMEFRPESGTTGEKVTITVPDMDVPEVTHEWTMEDIDLYEREGLMPHYQARFMREQLNSQIRRNREMEKSGEVKGTFVDTTPGKIYSGDMFRDGVSKVWETRPDTGDYVLTSESTRSTRDGISTIVTKKYSSPTAWGYEPSDKPYEITEGRVLNPRLLEKLGYDPNSEEDMRRAVGELSIGGWANGLPTIPAKKTIFSDDFPAKFVTELGQLSDTYTIRGHTFTTPEEVGVAYGIGNISEEDYRIFLDRQRAGNEEYRKKMSESVVETGGKPVRTATTITFDDYGRDMIAEDVYQVGGDPISHKEYGWLRPTEKILGSGDHPETELLYQRYDKTLGALRTVRSTEFDPELDSAVTYEYDTHGDRVARTYIEPRVFFAAYNPKTTEDKYLSVLQAQLRFGVGKPDISQDYPLNEPMPPIVTDHGIFYRNAASIRQSRSADGSWVTDMVSPGNFNYVENLYQQIHEEPNDVLPFDLKGGNSKTRLDAKGGESADVRAATKGGDGGGGAAIEIPTSGSPAPQGGPRIVINPSTFRNEKDALCVAFNEAFRIVMEMNGFEPVSEPTEAQRKFFSDTAYSQDELQLRRTILARICTFDTSVKDPTDEQLQEAVEFLDTVMEIGAPQNEWEQAAVQRIRDVIESTQRRNEQVPVQGEPAQQEGSRPVEAA